MDEIMLRAMEPEDLDVLYSIENDIELWSAGYTTVPYSRYILHDCIANATCDIYADRQVRLMAVTRDTNDVVGIVDITGYEPRHNRAELGLVIRKKYRNKGYGRVIVEEILRYTHSVIHLHQLYVVIDERNERALELFKNFGFEASHVLKEWLFDGEKYGNAVFLTYFQ